jgi:hypothetical protein
MGPRQWPRGWAASLLAVSLGLQATLKGVSDEGRQLLADLLTQLSIDQIRDLFVASRVEERGETIKRDGVERPVTVDDWVQAFLAKRDQISKSNHRCAVAR